MSKKRSIRLSEFEAILARDAIIEYWAKQCRIASETLPQVTELYAKFERLIDKYQQKEE